MSSVPDSSNPLNRSHSWLAKSGLVIHPLVWPMGTMALILFICSVLRHEAFRSTAYDLAIFDQAVYLISQGQTPFSTVRHLHILGDHAALILYPIALLYKIYPHVYWLFAVQAIGLALGALPTWGLAIQAGLTPKWAWTVAVAYLLYPLIFTINFFDFHPEMLAPFAILSAVWAARSGRLGWFVAAIFLTLSLKAVVALAVIGLGFWLWVFERKRRYGAIALISGFVWFIVASRWIIPTFSGEEPAAVWYFHYLGNSVPEIARNLVLKPERVFSHFFTLQNLGYLAKLVAPLLWGLSLRGLTPLVSAIPILGINLLSEGSMMQNPTYQYSLPILPFLILSVITTLANGRGLLQKHRRLVLIWSLVGFVSMSHYYKIPPYFVKAFSSGQATREAIAHLPPEARVAADRFITPHVCHRTQIRLIDRHYVADRHYMETEMEDSDYFLIDLDLAKGKDTNYLKSLVQKTQENPAFQIIYQQDQVYLFKRLGLQTN